MKRKKWTEAEEETLIGEYSVLLSSGSLAKLRTREKKFQPIADRVNALHHLCNPAAFPFRWSWRDVSIKIQNMRHQYLGVKQKILRLPPSPSSSAAPNFDWDDGVHLWPNFLRYKHVFGDVDLDPSKSAASASDLELDSEDVDGDEEEEELAAEDGEEAEMKDLGAGVGFVKAGTTGAKETGFGLRHDGGGSSGGRGGRLGIVARRVVELGEIAMRREENRREREAAREGEEGCARELRRRAREHWWEADRGAALRCEEESRARWRRREERMEEEEMEWQERLLVMQMEHEKQVMQMHADACQAQMQVLGLLGRLVCQFLGPSAGGGDGGLGGLPHQIMHLQQHPQPSLVGDDGKNDAHSSDHCL